MQLQRNILVHVTYHPPTAVSTRGIHIRAHMHTQAHAHACAHARTPHAHAHACTRGMRARNFAFPHICADGYRHGADRRILVSCSRLSSRRHASIRAWAAPQASSHPRRRCATRRHRPPKPFNHPTTCTPTLVTVTYQSLKPLIVNPPAPLPQSPRS